MEWRFYGPDAVLVRFADKIGEAAFNLGQAIISELDEKPPAGLIEFVPAFTTVLLEFEQDSRTGLAALMPELLQRFKRASERPLPRRKLHEIPVRYDGEDLERVAQTNGLSVEQVCELHCEREYRVYFLGFSPGFPYLGDLNPRLNTPRLASPRSRVAAGSVAIGGEQTGIYSVETPGGWNIIGHTDTPLFDPSAEDSEMFLMRSGDRVRFIPTESTS